MRVALVQLNSSDDPDANLETTLALTDRCTDADLILTPEVTNCVSACRDQQQRVLRHEADDPTLAAIQAKARSIGRRILIGSLALRGDDGSGKFVNRSFLIGSDGSIDARYDKMHMFDVTVSPQEHYRESDGYNPGSKVVLAKTPDAMLGLTICYDLRFPALYRTLAQAGAQVICVPSAFSPVTGAAHWETLLRARAIESGCFILAPAQTGDHPTPTQKHRRTYGHSLAVDPWGNVIADGGTEPGVTEINLDLELVCEARQRIPALTHDRAYTGP